MDSTRKLPTDSEKGNSPASTHSTGAPFSFSRAIQQLQTSVLRSPESKDTQSNQLDSAQQKHHSQKLAALEQLTKRREARRAAGGQTEQSVFKRLELEAGRDIADVIRKLSRLGGDSEDGQGGKGGGGGGLLLDEDDIETLRPAEDEAGGCHGPSGASKKTKLNFAKPNGTQILIPLASNDHLKLGEIKKVIRNEYAARYCEAIGVNPTPYNITLIHHHMPLDTCRIAQMVHPGIGRGERRNNLIIEPAFYATGSKRGAEDPLDEEPYEVLLEQKEDEQQEEAKGASHSRTTPTPLHALFDESHAQRRSIPQFENYKEKFVYPFNASSRPSSGTKRKDRTTPSLAPPLPPPPTEETEEGGASPAATQQPSGKKRNSPRDRPKLPRLSFGQPSRQTSRPPPADDKLGAKKEKVGPAASLRGSVAPKLKEHDELIARLFSKTTNTTSVPLSGSKKQVEVKVATQQPATQEQLAHLEALLARAPVVIDETLPGERATGKKGLPSSSGPPPLTSEPTTKTGLDGESIPLRFSQKEVVDTLINKELDRETAPRFDIVDVQTTVQGFVRDFPFERVFHKYCSVDPTFVRRHKELLLSDTVIGCVKSLLDFIYAAYFSQLGGQALRHAVQPTQIDQLFIHLYQRVLVLTHDRTRSHHGVATELPLLNLCFRVAVDCTFSSLFPAFCRESEVGRKTMKSIDAFIMAIVDPLNLGSHLTGVESAVDAMKMARRMTASEGNTAQHVAYSTTSPLLQFVVSGTLRSTEAKKLAKGNAVVEEGLNQLKAHLTPFVRSQLLHLITQERILK